ncbi:hypothetical protein HX773_24340 [Pantoea sp. B9002]|uniref:hypothetical protein n=1 Tax=Pantoea sp. B9002 TaxID=2726979 RepID=UPI0015A28554|nr:hypothetical protein [Pantoea sp. B9002]NWA64032.1 hypothetical protein [Pantoea sp. B9002]
MNEININSHVRKIRRLAAEHQAGTSLLEIKLQVDNIIQSMRDSLINDKDYQLTIWSAMLTALEQYITNMADPKWLDVISHARSRVKSRRNSLLAYNKPKNDKSTKTLPKIL